jgi:hypothetical protein
MRLPPLDLQVGLGLTEWTTVWHTKNKEMERAVIQQQDFSKDLDALIEEAK